MANAAGKEIRPISRILIANRGEIARRIMRTAHDMGIATVAIFAESDVDAPFVQEADLAIALEGRTSSETYLNVDKVLDAVKRSGADAVHPGYGFLSENSRFAKAVSDLGIAWIGPSTAAIEQMGDKLAAKRVMQEAGVPTLPAVEINPGCDVNAAAMEIGYPVLVKAAAGGGGKGMRVVEDANELDEAIAGARREASASFGDETLFLERWLTESRHVEIQILGDRHGNQVHCFERECSIQRRHQKIIEEAPSPVVTAEIRNKMGDAAVAAARKIGYTSAGTVEFLLVGDKFWFLEVNTRLQVEHPVTEEITGLDLVREQIRIAEGEELSFTQDELSISGHAIEARLYAEDPDNDFLPAPGKVVVWEPSQAGNARFDSGVESGCEVSSEFDPMIAKIIVHAPTRREAAGRLARVLETTNIQGLKTNRDFLVSTLRTPEYLAGDTTTDFIERVNPDRTKQVSREELATAAIAVVVESRTRRRAAANVLTAVQGGWRNSRMPLERVRFRMRDEILIIEYEVLRDGRLRFVVDECESLVIDHNSGDGDLDLEINGSRIGLSIVSEGDSWFVHGPGGDCELIELPRFPLPGADGSKGGLTAPMPGAVISVNVNAGDEVSQGQVLLILEAMKMEHRIVSPRDGKVKEVHVVQGDQVDNGALLVVLDEDED